MSKAKRWTRWIVTESAAPGLPLPWELGGGSRRLAQGARG